MLGQLDASPSTCQKMNFDLFTLYRKNNLKLIIDINIRLKQSYKKKGKIFKTLDQSNFFMRLYEKKNKLDLIKIQSFCASKYTVKKIIKTSNRMVKNICKTCFFNCIQNFRRTHVKELEPSCIAGGNVQWYSQQFVNFLKTQSYHMMQ